MTRTRKNQSELSATERQHYLAALQTMIDGGEYGRFVAIHGDMSHRMHDSDMNGHFDPVGAQRFLTWHRDFLLHFEDKLGVSVPYWDWSTEHDVPAWLKSVKPAVPMPDGKTIHVIRYLDHGAIRLPSMKSVAHVLRDKEFDAFSEGLERLHDLVHVWAGGVHRGSTSRVERGTMADIMISPADPLFWLHHAQVDRIWSQWQKDHAGKGPTLHGATAIMDPWPESVTDLEHTDALGGKLASHSYVYQ